MLSEERLRQAAHHAAQALEDSLPPPSQCHYDVSPEFRRNMKKLCRQAKRRPYRKVWKAVACAALVLILGSTSYLGLNAQAREAFFGWVTQITQNVSHYFFSRKITVTFCRRFQRAIRRMRLTKMVACARNCMSTSGVSTWHLKLNMSRKTASMSCSWIAEMWKLRKFLSMELTLTSMLTRQGKSRAHWFGKTRRQMSCSVCLPIYRMIN